MAMRSAVARMPRPSPAAAAVAAATRRSSRCFSGDKGKVLSEEERAAENVYIQKMEREKKEKLKRKVEREKAEAEKAKTSGEKTEEAHKG